MPAKAHALLEEDVRALTLRLALPGLLAMTATGAATLLDALMLSRMGGAQTAAAAVGFPLLTLFQTIGFTLGMGAGCTVSQAIGRGDENTPRRSAALALLLALAVSLALSALGLAFTPTLVRLLGAAPALEAEAVRYARALLLCGPPLCASLVLGSLLRARGRLRSYAAAHALGAALGAALELLLVAYMGLGVGAVGASMLAREGLTLLLLARAMRGALPAPPGCAQSGGLLFRLCRIRHPADEKSPPGLGGLLAELTRYGLPTLLRQGLMCVSSALLSRTAAAFGEAALGGMGLAVRALALVSSAIIGFGQGFQPVCGANAGAGRMGRVRESFFFCLRVLVPSLLLAGAALFFLARPLLSLLGAPQEAAAFGARVLRWQSPVLAAQGVVVLSNMLTQSLGMTVRATLIATSRQGLFFLPLLLALPRLLGETGLVLCQSASDALSLLLTLLLLRGAPTGSACARCGCSGAPTACR